MNQPAAQAKSVCLSPTCGVLFDGEALACPTCGYRALPQARIRTLGAVIAGCGVVIVGTMLVGAATLIPAMLNDGPDGDTWTGTPGDTFFALAVLTLVTLLGVAIIVAGVIQARRGRQDWRVVKIAAGLAVAMSFASFAIKLGVLG